MRNFYERFLKNNICVLTAWNLILVLLLYQVCRIAFFVINKSFFPDTTASQMVTICLGGLRFDLTATLYTNILYLLMMLIPFRFRYKQKYQLVAKLIFWVMNGFALLVDCMDIPYFRFTSRRTTMSFFSEFKNDNNTMSIIGDGLVEYWYVAVLFAAVLFLLIKLYKAPNIKQDAVYQIYTHSKESWLYYVRNTVFMLLAVMFSIFGMRGGIGSFVRPITLSNANVYVNKPLEASIVLNTPFCLLRTIGKKPYKDPHYFKSEKEIAAVYQPIVLPHPNGEFKKMNVVVFIMESFSKEFVGVLNKTMDGGKYKGYTPFLDSLIQHSLTFEYTFSNGRKSIDAMPSVLSSIPRFYEPYFLTSYSNNKVSGIAGELDKKGYYTAFFHGAPNGSMGFEAFAHVSGFKHYYGMNEYNNSADYDGTWAIWDEKFFQFFANKMTSFRQPFMTALFSATSHHPFVVPEEYKSRFPEVGGHPIHKCIEYSDMALQHFFKTASKQPWFKNTLFVITADHTNALTKPDYTNDAGSYKVPIVFYTPNGSLRGHLPVIAQQIDIMPTILGYLNYDKPFIAYGNDVLDPKYTHHYACNFNDQIFQFFQDSLMLQFDGQHTRAIYNFVSDVRLKKNIKTQVSAARQKQMETKLKAIIQQYIERMTEDRMTMATNAKKK